MKKRIFAFFLSVILLLAALPYTAFAYGHDATNPLPAGEYKSWSQEDPRWKDVKIGVDPWTDSQGNRHENETIGHAGCLISSMAILARAYGLTLADGTAINPGTLGTAMYDDGSCKYLNYKGAAKYQTAFDTLIPGISYYTNLFSKGKQNLNEMVPLKREFVIQNLHHCSSRPILCLNAYY